jgi:hypothetical protein
MAGGNSIINVNGLGEPIKVFIEKCALAVEGGFKPYQIKRLAKAEAEANIIRTKNEIENYNLKQRALLRLANEEAKKQSNMESIRDKAIPLLNQSAESEKVEDDWITNFFDKCRLISDEEMQTLWSKVLAGEANSPGSFSKRTINLLGSLDKTDAQMFSKLCGFMWIIEEVDPLIYDEQESIYRDQGINFEALNHLDNSGLITYGPITGYSHTEMPKHIVVRYFNTLLNLEFVNSKDNELQTGVAIFTQAGSQLAKICGAKPVDRFYDYIVEKWSKEHIILSSPLSEKI